MASADGNKKNVSKGHFVPSRYKQAAEKVATQSTKDTKYLTVTHNATKMGISNTNSSHSRSNDSGSFSQIRIISTPTKDQVEMPSNDASCISVIDQSLCPVKIKENLVPRRNLKAKKALEKEYTFRGPMIVPQLEKKTSDMTYNDEAAEDELDIVYAEYLQALFLESQAKKTLELRSKNAFESIYRVWNLIEILLEKDKGLDKDIDKISYMINLHKHLCKHEEMLQPILEVFPLFLTQCKTIAEAIDSVRHKLPVTGVSSLDSDMEDKIINLLKSFETALEHFLKTSPKQECLSEAAKSLSSVASCGDNINQEINRCTDNLYKVDDLLVTETSLVMSKNQLKVAEITDSFN